MKRVLVIAPGVWDKQALALPHVATNHQFIFIGEEFQERPSLLEALRFDVFGYVRRVVDQFRSAKLTGVVGTGDYPACMLAPLVAQELGLHAPRAQDVVVLSHKFYSRQIQQRVVPHATPIFAAIDPFAARYSPLLSYPFFVKPVKGTMSIRAQMVHGPAALAAALRFSLRERLEGYLLLRPYAQLLRKYTDGKVPAHWFIAEAPLKGNQVTVDGFVQDGSVVVTGIVDSVMHPGTRSFQRFEYPSSLPTKVQERMVDIATTLISGAGLDHTCFNIEMFHDAITDRVHVIEVNPRMSYQFADLYERVDGMNTYEVQLALATGTPVRWVPRQGRDGAAASFVLRRFQDALVVAVPTEAQVAQACREHPETVVKILCHIGERLSQLDQDVGSFRYGIINMGAANLDQLHETYALVKQRLPFEFR